MRFNFFLDILFPLRCAGCQAVCRDGVPLCPVCENKIQPHTSFFCAACRARLPQARKICHKGQPYVLGAATDYADPAVRGLIHNLKFNSMRSAAVPLGRVLISYAKKLPISFEKFLVVPIPLSKERERERGFNQAHLVAEVFAGAFSLPLRTDILHRIKSTIPQSTISGHTSRFENIQGAFALGDTSQLSAQKIILIDDVSTSGATFFEAASTLKAARVKEIIALAVARG